MNHKILSLLALTLALGACGKNSSDQQSLGLESAQDQSIVGGEAVEAGDVIAKSTVALAHPLYGVFCTATLISKNLVLTAGHCTGLTRDPRQMIVIFSTKPNQAKATDIRKVLGGKTTEAWPKVTRHQQKNWGDIAVLRFEGTVPEGYAPAPILGNKTLLQDGTDVVLAGFGLTSMSPQTDPERLMKVAIKVTEANFSETEIRFEQQDGKGACHGDSGGPAFATVKGRPVLVGVTSRSATEAGGHTCLEGSVYTSVPAMKEFLVSAAKFLNSKEFKPGQPIPQPADE